MCVNLFVYSRQSRAKQLVFASPLIHEAIERVRTEQDERFRHKELALEQARYEAARARRQYDAIEPENRLVAAELERRWGQHRWSTDAETIDIVRALARTLPDQGIAAVINRLGKRTARGHTWTAARVCTLRNHHGIDTYREGERQERAELTVAEVSKLVGVSAPTVIRLIRAGRIPANQACPGAPWLVRQTDIDAYLIEHANGHPQSAEPNQLSIDLQ
jgi:excisionase family DNA binding protein